MTAEKIARSLSNAYSSGGWWRKRCPVHNSTGATLALRDIAARLGILMLILPDRISDVTIACDPDPVGVMAARAAVKRWLAEGRRVPIFRPPLGLDFNNLARALL